MHREASLMIASPSLMKQPPLILRSPAASTGAFPARSSVTNPRKTMGPFERPRASSMHLYGIATSCVHCYSHSDGQLQAHPLRAQC